MQIEYKIRIIYIRFGRLFAETRSQRIKKHSVSNQDQNASLKVPCMNLKNTIINLFCKNLLNYNINLLILFHIFLFLEHEFSETNPQIFSGSTGKDGPEVLYT